MAAPFFARVRTLVICDAVHQQPGLPERYNLENVRCEIRAASFPYTHPLLCVYLQATARQGMTPAHVVLSHGQTGEEVLRSINQDLYFSGPVEPTQVWWEMEACTFPSPGVYSVELYFGGRLSGEWSFFLSHDTVSSNGTGSP